MLNRTAPPTFEKKFFYRSDVPPLPLSHVGPHFGKNKYSSQRWKTNNSLILLELCHELYIGCLSIYINTRSEKLSVKIVRYYLMSRRNNSSHSSRTREKVLRGENHYDTHRHRVNVGFSLWRRKVNDVTGHAVSVITCSCSSTVLPQTVTFLTCKILS